jgi:hypothetical protein
MAEPKSVEELGALIARLVSQYQRERSRLDLIARYVSAKVNDIYIPKRANAEYKLLVRMARFNVLRIVERTLVQNLFVDGYRPTNESGRVVSSDNAPIWDAVWQPNRMDARQAAIYRPAVRFGYSYATVMPGDPTPKITPYSPRKLTALYDDPVNDEWPVAAMVVKRRMSESGSVSDGTSLTVYDDNFRYQVVNKAGTWELSAKVEVHNLGVCPVVRFLDAYGEDDDDLDPSDGELGRCEGLPPGKVEPLIPAQQQLNQTTFNLLMAGQFAAFKQRWVTGMAIDEDENGRARASFNAFVDEVLQAEGVDTKFGQFAETNLDGYLNSRDKTMLYVASEGQVPPHNLLVGAGISNISAEALAALESGHRHDIGDHQTSFGEGIEQTLRLAGRAMGGDEGTAAWEDTSAQVVWRDTTPRSLAQVADALGKLAQQLGIPPRALWERIPGVTDQDIARWEAMVDEQDAVAALETMFAAEPVAEEAPVAVASSNGADASPPT